MLVNRLEEWLERWFVRRFEIREVAEGGHIFRIGVVRYRGAGHTFADGTAVTRGDKVGELHINNLRVAALHESRHAGFRYRREVFRVLAALAKEVQTRPEYLALRAFGGPSLFWNEATLLGFEQWPVTRVAQWWNGAWERHLLARYHPAGRHRLAVGNRIESRQIWISRKTLIERWGGCSWARRTVASGPRPLAE